MYCAPEMLDGSRYNTGVDVYSYAITVFECLCGGDIARAQYRSVPRLAVCSGWRLRPTKDLVDKYPQAWTLIQECWRSDKTEDGPQMLVQQGAERDNFEHQTKVETSSAAALKRPTFTEIVERLGSMRPGLTCVPEHVRSAPSRDRSAIGHVEGFVKTLSTPLNAAPDSPHGTLKSEELKAAQARHRNSPKSFACFLSSHNTTCASEAKLVKRQLESFLDAKICLGKCPPYV